MVDFGYLQIPTTIYQYFLVFFSYCCILQALNHFRKFFISVSFDSKTEFYLYIWNVIMYIWWMQWESFEIIVWNILCCGKSRTNHRGGWQQQQKKRNIFQKLQKIVNYYYFQKCIIIWDDFVWCLYKIYIKFGWMCFAFILLLLLLLFFVLNVWFWCKYWFGMVEYFVCIDDNNDGKIAILYILMSTINHHHHTITFYFRVIIITLSGYSRLQLGVWYGFWYSLLFIKL